MSAGWRKLEDLLAGKQRYSLNFSKNVVRMRSDGTLNISDDYCLYCRSDGMYTHFYPPLSQAVICQDKTWINGKNSAVLVPSFQATNVRY